jgi:Fe-S-cluster containining protein
MPTEGDQSSAGPSQPLDKLEEKLAGGLHFTTIQGYMAHEALRENKATLSTLIELLVRKGVIQFHEIEQRKQEVNEALKATGASSGPQVHLVDTPDKYTHQDQVEIDCEARYHLCKASCCKLWFALSVQDLDERIVKWNYSRPYSIAQAEDGYCVHLNRGSCACSIYKNRPLTCRTYDCRRDKRIWLDFEQRVINPEIYQAGWPLQASSQELKVEAERVS